MRDYRSSADMAENQQRAAHDQQAADLMRMLMGERMKAATQQNELQMQGQQAKDLADYKDQLGQQGTQRNIQIAQDLAKQNPGMGVNVGENGNIGLSKPIDTGAAADRHERVVASQAEDYSKRMEHTMGFSNSLQDLEAVTNKLNNGQGGILTNPNYKPLSGGYLAGLQDHPEALAVAEKVGAVPAGTLEEAKAIARFRLQYQQSMTGMRTTEDMAKREAASMGATSSSDPLLMAKGIRALANLAHDKIQLQQSPYSQEALERVHTSMGNPLDAFPKVAQDNNVSNIANNGQSPAPTRPGMMQSIGTAISGAPSVAAPTTSGQQPAPTMSSFVPHPMTGKTVRDKVTGKVGTIDASGNFTPQE